MHLPDALQNKCSVCYQNLRKYDDGKTEWTEIEDLKKMEPCFPQSCLFSTVLS